MKSKSETDPWKSILTSLTLASSNSPDKLSRIALLPASDACRRLWPRTTARSYAQSIRILERKTNSTILVCWRDATSGQYAEQTWRLVSATRNGQCALSGCPIRRGDFVFHPSYRGAKIPANADVQILASQLPCPVDGMLLIPDTPTTAIGDPRSSGRFASERDPHRSISVLSNPR